MSILVLSLVAILASANDWPEHWDPTWEVAFSYPPEWTLYTAENPGPLGYFRPNQVAYCVSKSDPDLTFTVSVIMGVPPQPFATKMDASFSGMSRQSGAMRRSFRAFTWSGCEAVELVQRQPNGATALVQRVVALAGQANAFLLTCTAPEPVFDAVNRDVFTPVVESLTVGERGMVSFWRQMWKRASPKLRGASVALAIILIGAFSLLVLRRRPDEVRARMGSS
jgi:hypothetical protein